MDATPIDVPGDGNALRHDIPAPPFPPDVIPVDRVALGAPVDPSVVANPFRSEPAPLAPGQLAPGWKKLFIAGWVGVIAGFGCMWQAARVAGLAPWWLGPETDPRAFVFIALPFLAPVAAISFAAAQSRFAVFVGVAAGLASMAIALGDLDDFPGLAAGEAVVGLAGVLISVACFAGRMRRPGITPR